MKGTHPEVSLREVTKETLRDITRLRVRPDQELPGDGGPESFYLRLWFEPSGETFHGQVVGVRSLSWRHPAGCSRR